VIVPEWVLLIFTIIGLVSFGIWISKIQEWMWPNPDEKDIHIKLLETQIIELKEKEKEQKLDFESRLEAKANTIKALNTELSTFQSKVLTKLMTK
jgi:hypothetical protein